MKQEYRLKDTLRDMLKAVSEIENFTNGLNAEEFTSDTKTVSAVIYALEKLSLAAKHATRYAKRRQERLPPNIPWGETVSIARWLQGYRQKISSSIIWQTVQKDVPQIAHGLREELGEMQVAVIQEKPIITRIKLIAPIEVPLTSYYLQSNIVPYLKAITDLQRFVDEMLGRRDKGTVIIKSITQRSPISVNFSGALEATQLIQEAVIPWKRHHAQTMAQLLESEKITEIEVRRAEVLEKRALVSKEKAETDRIRADIERQREETEKLRLENEKLRLELQRAKVQLAMEILEKLNPSLHEQDKMAYFIRLLPIIDTFVANDLEISK